METSLRIDSLLGRANDWLNLSSAQQQQKGAERGGKADGESGQPDRQGGGGKPDRGAGLEEGGPSSQARGVAGGRGEQRDQME
jgi:hypothetical protein